MKRKIDSMKHAKTVLKNIVALLPYDLQKDAIDILSCKYLAQNTAQETSVILGLPITQVSNTLQAVKDACKGKEPADFIKCTA